MEIEQELQKLYGIGPVLAADIHAKLIGRQYISAKHRYDYEELRKILKQSTIFPELPISTRVDLQCNPLKEIPRAFIDIIDEELYRYIKEVKFDIAGSYRRNKPMSRDIDMVLVKKNIQAAGADHDSLDYLIAIINKRSKRIHICRTFARGSGKANMLFEIYIPKHLQHLLELIPNRFITNSKYGKRVRVKVDIFLAEPHEYIFALLFATGSGAFNVRMRAVAKRKGYLLNQKGIYRRTKSGTLNKISISHEKQVFKLLGMKYRSPEERIQ